jgi:hypothetical protein
MSQTALVPDCPVWCRSPLSYKGSEHFDVPNGTGLCRPISPDLAEDLADAAMQARTPNSCLVVSWRHPAGGAAVPIARVGDGRFRLIRAMEPTYIPPARPPRHTTTP